MNRIFNSKKLFSGILNVLGMTIAITAFLIISKQVWYDLTFDRNFEGADRVYRVEFCFNGSGDYGSTLSRPMIATFDGLSPMIEKVGEYQYYGDKGEFRVEENAEDFLYLSCAAADLDLLGIFSVNIIEGDISDFDASPLHCVICKSAADKLFPGESAVGKRLYTSRGYSLNVLGVYEDVPENCSIINGVISSLGNDNADNPSEWAYMCYIRFVGEGGIAEEEVLEIFVDRFIDQNRELMNMTEEDEAMLRDNAFRFHSLRDIYTSVGMQDSLPKANRLTTNTLLVVSILILAIAIINFINFSMASVPFDIRSINTRKVLGSSRRGLVLRKLMSSFATVFVSYMLGIIALHFISGTSFASYVTGSLKAEDNLPLLAAGIGVVLLISFVAGIYPALYSTSFQPALVLKGSFSLSEKGRGLRNALVGFQYVVTFVLSIFALYIFVQTRYMKKYDMGFTSEQVLMTNIGTDIGSKRDAFAQRLLENPDIVDVTFAGGSIVSEEKMGWGRYYDGEYVEWDVLPVAVNFVDFFGLEIVDGRDFIPSDEFSECGTFILNESSVAEYGFIGVGTKMQGHLDDGHPAEVVGVVKDFNFKPMQYAIGPFALYNFGANPWWPLYVAYIKVAPEGIAESMDYIRNTVVEFYPGVVASRVNVWFLDESIGSLYQKEERLNWIIIVAAIVSFVISLIGVLGLIYFETQFKRKEIALKKVYGADIFDILRSINRRYVVMALVSFAVALPLAIAVIKVWVGGFPYQAPVPVWIFALSLMLTLLVTVVTVTVRAYGAAASNPVESIKNE